MWIFVRGGGELVPLNPASSKGQPYSTAMKRHVVTVTITQRADTPTTQKGRVSLCMRTLTKQQVISEQTDEVDTAGLGIVGPRNHGYLLIRTESKW